MKTSKFSSGMLAVLLTVSLLTFAFAMTGCGEGAKPSPVVDPPLTGEVSIIGIAEVGETLYADTYYLDGSGEITYVWRADGTVVGGNSETYQIREADIGKTITVTVTRAGYSGSRTSAPTAVVVAPLPLLTGEVSISGIAEVGQTLTAVTTNLDGSGDISYQWRRSGFSFIGSGQTYEVQAADIGSAITVTVWRAGYTGSKTSAPTLAVTDPSLPPLTGTVNISGTAAIGQTLTANTESLGGEGNISYQWKAGERVVGGNNANYSVQVTDAGSAITVTVTRTGNSRNVTSDPTAVIPIPAVMSLNDWTSGYISSSSDVEWFSFNVEKTDTYFFHFKPGNFSQMQAQIYDSDGNISGSAVYLWSSSRSASRTLSAGLYYIRVSNWGSPQFGGYELAVADTFYPPGITPAQLTHNTWLDGNIAEVRGEQWFKFTATAAEQFFHFEPGTVTGVFLQLYTNTGELEGNSLTMTSSSATGSISDLTVGTTYYGTVTAFWNESGTYRVAFNASPIAPGVIWPPQGAAALAANSFTGGNIAEAGGEQWFSFNAVSAGTHFIHLNFNVPGTIHGGYVQVHTSAGLLMGGSTNYISSSNPLLSREFPSSGTYYIKFTGTPTGTGNFEIAVNNSVVPPGAGTPVALTFNQWGEATHEADKQEWFTINITETGSHFIHFEYGTLPTSAQMRIQVINSAGSNVGSEHHISYGYSSGNIHFNAAGMYYLRVRSTSSSAAGTFKIAVNNIPLPPGSVWPPASSTALTMNSWANGNIAAQDTQEWFSFTAPAAGMYFLHFKAGGTNSLQVNIWDSNGSQKGVGTLWDGNAYQLSADTGVTYYIRTAASSGSTGTYQIAVNDIPLPPGSQWPPASPTALIMGEWVGGNIVSEEAEEWFSFTAGAERPYMHFKAGEAASAQVTVYSINGIAAATSFSGSHTNSMIWTTPGVTYYVRVTYFNHTGSYQLGLSDSTTPPAGP